MKKIILLLLVFMSSSAWAAMPVLNYKNITCRLVVDGVLVKEQSQSLMTLMIEERLGRFVQIQFGDEQKTIQYQILIEDDVNSPVADSVLILQNLMIGELESSSEVSAKEVTWIRIAQGTHSVSCDLKP